MAKTYQQVLHQISALQQEADKVRAAEVKGVVARIRGAIEAYGLTAADLGLQGGVAFAVRSAETRVQRRPVPSTRTAKETPGAVAVRGLRGCAKRSLQGARWKSFYRRWPAGGLTREACV
jgi:DNA-binding protein H-NS